MKKPKEYRLLKDAPGVKSGAIFTWDKKRKSYVYEWDHEYDYMDNRWIIGKEEMLDLVKEGWLEEVSKSKPYFSIETVNIIDYERETSNYMPDLKKEILKVELTFIGSGRTKSIPNSRILDHIMKTLKTIE